jgi:hypothetical protein
MIHDATVEVTDSMYLGKGVLRHPFLVRNVELQSIAKHPQSDRKTLTRR